jgi:putative transcriptional regulator
MSATRRPPTIDYSTPSLKADTRDLRIRKRRRGASAAALRARTGCYLWNVSRSELCSSLLVAMPQLADPNFRRAVVLVVHHDFESTFGLVLNREVELSMRELCESLEFDWKGRSEAEVAWGGPVESNTGWLLFQDGLDTEIEADTDGVTSIDGELCFASSLDVLRRLALRPPHDLRVFLGYAGWGEGQLEFELAQGAWVVAPLSAATVFDVPAERMWEHVLREMDIDPVTLISTAGVH